MSRVQTLADLRNNGGGSSTMTETIPLPERHISTVSASSVSHQFQTTQAAYSTGIDYQSQETVYHQGQRVLNEVVRERETLIPKKVVVEETIMVPQTVRKEKIVQESQKVRDRVIQVAQEVWVDEYQEYEVPEYHDKIIEVPEYRTIYQEKPVEKLVLKEVVVEKPVIREKIVQVPYDDPQYVEREVVRTVEVPEYKIVYKDIPKPVDQYRVVEIPVPKEIETYTEIVRKVPVGVEKVVHQTYELTQPVAEYEDVPYHVITPQFVEVPVPADQMTEQARLKAEAFAAKIRMATAQQVPSLCEIENLAHEAKNGRHLEMETDPDKLRRKQEEMIAKCEGKA